MSVEKLRKLNENFGVENKKKIRAENVFTGPVFFCLYVLKLSLLYKR